jgi:hypothetical protein
MARVTYLGLDMDATMVAKIVAALRGLYPNLVSPADSDNRVIQLCLHQIITEHLAAWAARSATDPIDVIVKQATDTAKAEQQAAVEQARTDAADIQPTATA